MKVTDMNAVNEEIDEQALTHMMQLSLSTSMKPQSHRDTEKSQSLSTDDTDLTNCKLQIENCKSNKLRSHHRHGFSMTEALAALVIGIILLCILIPYVSYNWEVSNRVTCADNLAKLRDAIQQYWDTNRSYPRVVYDTRVPDTYTSFTGADEPNVFAPESAVKPNDVTASLWLLVRTGFVTDTRIFVCPSSRGYPDLITNAEGKSVEAKTRGNFRDRRNLTYSLFFPFASVENYNNRDMQSPEFVVMSDLNPGGTVGVDASRPMIEQAPINSPNHGGAGQNVLYSSGGVTWQTTPYCGKNNDNIYSVRRTKPSTQPENLPANTPGIISNKVGPISPEDSYLVPTAAE